MKNFFSLVLLFNLFSVLSAQENFKWKAPEIEDFKYSVPKNLSKYPAIILKEEANISFFYNSKHIKVLYKIKRRIKILNEKGLKYATFEIHYIAKSKFEKILQIDGFVYSLSDSGKIFSKKIKKPFIKTIKINDFIYKKVITFPEVNEGDIIDIYYTLASSNVSKIQKWYFQHYDLPSLFSRFIITIPEFLNYRIEMKGKEYLTENLTQDTNITFLWIKRNSPIVFNGNKLTFEMKNQKPLLKEPFMPSRENYIYSIHFHPKFFQNCKKIVCIP